MTSGNKSIEILLKEYDALRSEIITAMQARNSILSFGLATVGVLFTAVAAVFVTGNNTLFAALVMMIIVPLIVLFILLIWLGEYQRMHRAGQHIIKLEHRINSEASYELLTCETKLRDSKGHMGYPYDTTIILLILILFSSFSIGVSITDFTKVEYSVLAYVCGAAFAIVIYVSAVNKMTVLRS